MKMRWSVTLLSGLEFLQQYNVKEDCSVCNIVYIEGEIVTMLMIRA